MTDVRTIRRADELKVGDWLAASMAEDDFPTEVAALVPYSTAENGPFIEITFRQPDGSLGHWPVLPEAVLTLATAAEVAAQQGRARRARVAEELVRLADLILKRELPLPASYSSPVVSFQLSRDVAAVERVAEVLGLKVERAERTVQAWMGVQGEAPVTVYWSAYLPKETAPAVDPDPDPTGLAYSRADDADDPTPVSPARVPLHTGGVVDGGRLVDETPAESEGVFNGLPDCSPACERQVLTQDTKHLADCPRSVALIARFGTSKAGQPREPQAADTVPVPAEDATVRGIDPDSSMEAHYDAEAEEILSPARRQELLLKRAVGWAGSLKGALFNAHVQALVEDNDRAKMLVELSMTAADEGRITNPDLARFMAVREDRRRNEPASAE